MNKPQKIFLLAMVLAAVAGGIFFGLKNKTKPEADGNSVYVSVERDNSIPAEQEMKPKEAPTPAPAPEEKSNPSLPVEINLEVPFTSQAPSQNWDVTHEEFCEEASMLMAASYVKNQTIDGIKDAETKLQAIKNFEIKRLGYFKDTTAKETAEILREYFEIPEVQVVYNPKINDVKSALADGKVIIVPLAGREIGNPNFTQPGPLYHMLLIKGYTKGGELITNDPGTRKGADYKYKEEVIMNAIHDWNDGKVETGKRVMIIVG